MQGHPFQRGRRGSNCAVCEQPPGAAVRILRPKRRPRYYFHSAYLQVLTCAWQGEGQKGFHYFIANGPHYAKLCGLTDSDPSKHIRP
jgi:hypothetical protein